MRHAHRTEATAVHPETLRAERLSLTASTVVAALLGFFVLYGVGFASIPALHNAAHDARHALGFPCH
jgi:cobalt transporter subunit CbtB